MICQSIIKKLLGITICFFCASIIGTKTDITVKEISKNNHEIHLSIHLEPGDFIYKDYIEITTDHPYIQLSDWNTDKKAISIFSKEFGDTKKVYKTDFSITIQASKNMDTQISDANIHLSYYLHSKNGLIEEVFPLKIDNSNYSPQCIQTNVNIPSDQKIESKRKTKNANAKKEKKTWTTYVSGLVKTSQSIWLQILLAILLGALLSLTPCIYPMIPITVGLLQAQGSKSLLHNFLLSFLYIAGISVTFSILGLIAAFTGQLLGSILINPIFVSVLILILIYFALSLFGFYDLYIPKFLSSVGSDTPGKGGLLSIFLFGLASGTIASPCVSPGLVLLLSIVTAMGSKLLGFLLLFAFGMGLGTPLLIIGTFSGSINMMPKAGSWMVEIKKIFGIMMLFVCFYFLNNILPWYILLWILAMFMITIGIYYLLNIRETDSQFWKIFKSLLGIIFCASSILIATKALKETKRMKIKKEDTFWHKDFTKALAQAKKENKSIFLDFWAEFCSICKVIDKRIFQDPNVRNILSQKCINVKIDATNPKDPQFVALRKKYTIIGVPTFIIINPKTQQIIKKWTADLNNLSNDAFIQEIHNI